MNLVTEAPVSTGVQTDERLVALLNTQREYFLKGNLQSIDFRLEQIRKLRDAIKKYDKQILEALHKDLRKSEMEAFGGEIGFCYDEIAHTLKHLRGWAKPRKVFGPLTQFLSTGAVHYKPYGQTLVIAPWNYPFQLAICPILGALSAGNTVILKPSELAPATSAVLAKMLSETFPPEIVAVVEGGIETNQQLLALRFDYIFFTGSPNVGKIVMQAAAKNLVPVTLELGGKSPVFVDNDTHIDNTAKRIVWGKFYNMGQTCIAPDYLLVDKRVKTKLVERMKYYITQFYGADPQQSPDLGRIINERHFSRLNNYLKDGNVLVGGQTNASEKYIAPTLLDQVSEDSPVMQDEIFGPILPILEYDNIEDAIRFVQRREPPLALYIFTNSKSYEKKVLDNTNSGGSCVNDTLIHITSPEMPFGGVGHSGIGQYHGRDSFLTFSHQRSVLFRSNLIDPPIRYAPYKNKVSLIRRLMPLPF
jgi:aldehyde dehydrogenase (NAD+)